MLWDALAPYGAHTRSEIVPFAYQALTDAIFLMALHFGYIRQDIGTKWFLVVGAA